MSLRDIINGEVSMKVMEDLTTRANQIQQQVLEEILRQNAETEYLRNFLGKQLDKETFKKKVPIVDYKDIKPYIERISNGEPSILTSNPVSEFIISSGTSGGQPKLFPTTAEELDRKSFFYNLVVPVKNQYVGDLDQGKGMYLCFTRPEISTSSRLTTSTALTSYYKSRNFRNRPFNKFNVYTSPDETILCTDSKQSMYCQLLCGLIQREEVLWVGAVFASSFLNAIKFLENYWEELCSNIRNGHVSDWITDPSCRNATMTILKGNSELADRIEYECRQKSWEGIVTRLWPRTKYIETIVSGSMGQYISTLEFYGGGIPLFSMRYAFSECFFGINLNPICKPSDVSYTTIPNMAYFEFIRIERNSGEPNQEEKAVDLVDVKLGHNYELLVTTFSGLYRYRVGDVLKVTGFYNNTPQFRFVHRKNAILSIDGDKTNEEDLLNAVTQAKLLLEPLGVLLTEYTSYADTSSLPGHYVLFWELGMKGNGDVPDLDTYLMEQCCNVVEESLDFFYRFCRTEGKSIGPLEIRVVKQGAFDELMDLSVSQGSSVNQYKTPRCMKSDEGIEILNKRVVGRFFSMRPPAWKPFSMDGSKAK